MDMIRRHRLTYLTDTGATVTDTGPHIMGMIDKVVLEVTDTDTGGDITLMLLNRPGDTGASEVFLSHTDVLGVSKTFYPRAYADPIANSDTGDTSAARHTAWNRISAAGEQLKLSVTTKGSAAGKVYVYTDR